MTTMYGPLLLEAQKLVENIKNKKDAIENGSYGFIYNLVQTLVSFTDTEQNESSMTLLFDSLARETLNIAKEYGLCLGRKMLENDAYTAVKLSSQAEDDVFKARYENPQGKHFFSSFNNDDHIANILHSVERTRAVLKKADRDNWYKVEDAMCDAFLQLLMAKAKMEAAEFVETMGDEI